MIRFVIFDLDGTLVDSVEDIARSVNEMLETLGRPPLPRETIQGYVGDGVRKLVERALGPVASAEAIERARALYLPIYRRRLLQHTRPYPGVVEALEELRRDRLLAVLTNKPLRESLSILEGLGLSRYFQAVCGGDSFPRKKPDPMGVRHLLSLANASSAESLLVGDSPVDLECARNASVLSCFVRYGLGAPPDASSRPDFAVDDIRELVPTLSSS